MPEAGPFPAGFLHSLQTETSPGSVMDATSGTEGFLAEERGLFDSRTDIVLAPASTGELARAVSVCAEYGVPVVPQGGNTGLVGGAVARPGEVLVSLRRMRRIIEIDPENFTATVEAGCVLAELQAAAAAADCLFPLSLGSEGSCTIGGNIASNAGGITVLRYGNMRDLTLGLEVVLPDGQVWDGLRPLYKDNSGFSFRNLFVGSEGSIGIVTKAVVKLFPAPRQSATAFCAIDRVDQALALLALARRRSGDDVSAFELMSAFTLAIVCRHAGGQVPVGSAADWYVLVELSTPREGADLTELMESILAEGFEAGLIRDAVVAQSGAQAAGLRRLRESVPEAQKRAGGSIKHDVSVRVSALPAFIAEASAAVLDYLPAAHICAFGHVGDGNVHFNISQPDEMAAADFLALWTPVNDIVHSCVARHGGSISAEHGIGLLKVEEVQHYRSKTERDMTAAIKAAFDPQNLCNPGKFTFPRK